MRQRSDAGLWQPRGASIGLWMLVASLSGGCGGGSDAYAGSEADAAPSEGAFSVSLSSTSTSSSSAQSANVVPITVGPGTGLGRTYNRARISVELCAPRPSTQCQTISHVLVDTGSTGLRLNRKAIDPSLLALLPSVEGQGGTSLSECQRFAGSLVWGELRRATVNVGGKRASDLAFQAIDDTSVVPAECSSNGSIPQQQPDADSSNGIIGLSSLVSERGLYYRCGSGGCSSRAMASSEIAGVLKQPVAMFDGDNNGLVIELPPVPDGRARSVTGTLTFGIGTRANNGLADEPVFKLDAYGYFARSAVNGVDMGPSMIDSGIAFYWLADATLPLCADGGYLCPPAASSLSSSIRSDDGVAIHVPFTIGHAYRQLADTSFNVVAQVGRWRPATTEGGPYAYYGLPFFYGRKVFVALEGATVVDRRGKRRVGPFNAFTASAATSAL